MLLFYFWHVFACLYWRASLSTSDDFCAASDDGADFYGDARVSGVVRPHPCGAWVPPPALLRASFGRQYVHAYYWSLASSTGQYGEAPQTSLQLFLTMITGLFAGQYKWCRTVSHVREALSVSLLRVSPGVPRL